LKGQSEGQDKGAGKMPAVRKAKEANTEKEQPETPTLRVKFQQLGALARRVGHPKNLQLVRD
jgi:hypothetical protein